MNTRNSQDAERWRRIAARGHALAGWLLLDQIGRDDSAALAALHHAGAGAEINRLVRFVRADCEVKRGIVQRYSEALSYLTMYGNDITHGILHDVVWDIAQRYRDRPGFRRDWMPMTPPAVMDGVHAPVSASLTSQLAH